MLAASVPPGALHSATHCRCHRCFAVSQVVCDTESPMLSTRAPNYGLYPTFPSPRQHIHQVPEPKAFINPCPATHWRYLRSFWLKLVPAVRTKEATKKRRGLAGHSAQTELCRVVGTQHKCHRRAHIGNCFSSGCN